MSGKILYEYDNGNTHVVIESDGTRTITIDDDEFEFALPCNADIKITNCCPVGCPWCHEKSVPEGKHAPLENFKFLETWGIGKECALGGGSITTYPYLDELLHYIKDCKLIANTTVHQSELINNFDRIKKYQEEGLIHGIGISLQHPSQKLADCINQLDNCVIHVINGLFTKEEYLWILKNIQHPKILILGMKNFGRSIDWLKNNDVSKQQEWLYNDLKMVCNMMDVVSFDNLSLQQLEVRRLLTDEEWNLFYQGDEGANNMYVDAVEGKFAQNSTSTIRYDLMDNVKDMFDIIKKNSIR